MQNFAEPLFSKGRVLKREKPGSVKGLSGRSGKAGPVRLDGWRFVWI